MKTTEKVDEIPEQRGGKFLRRVPIQGCLSGDIATNIDSRVQEKQAAFESGFDAAA